MMCGTVAVDCEECLFKAVWDPLHSLSGSSFESKIDLADEHGTGFSFVGSVSIASACRLRKFMRLGKSQDVSLCNCIASSILDPVTDRDSVLLVVSRSSVLQSKPHPTSRVIMTSRLVSAVLLRKMPKIRARKNARYSKRSCIKLKSIFLMKTRNPSFTSSLHRSESF